MTHMKTNIIHPLWRATACGALLIAVAACSNDLDHPTDAPPGQGKPITLTGIPAQRYLQTFPTTNV